MKEYERIGCTIKLDESAEEMLNYLKIDIDRYINRLYVFLTEQPTPGMETVYVHASKTYTGKAHFLISFSDFKLPPELVPELPASYLEDLKREDSELYAEVMAARSSLGKNKKQEE